MPASERPRRGPGPPAGGSRTYWSTRSGLMWSTNAARATLASRPHAQLVERDRDHEHDPEHDHLPEGRDVEQHEPVRERAGDERADQRQPDAALPAGEA